jgi:phospholipase/lecithinase/hemolysin
MNRFTSQRLNTLVLTAAAVLAIGGSTAAARPFDELIVFGDSWSDNGNARILSEGLAVPPPYFGGRFSNGPLWVERLAERLHLGHPTESSPAPAPSLAGGTNYAFGGAQAGPGFAPDVCATVNGVRSWVPNIGPQI